VTGVQTCALPILQVISELGLRLEYTVDTHVHADHITGALHLKERVGSKIAAPAMERLPCTDVGLEDGVPLRMGSVELQPLHTPGHTATHFPYVLQAMVFTGDALLIDGFGRNALRYDDSTAFH